MYLRQLAYTIVSGREEQAIVLCERFAATLRAHGVRARVLVGGKLDTTLQLVEEYGSFSELETTRAALEDNSEYQRALSSWAVSFYPLVQAAIPAIILHDQQAA